MDVDEFLDRELSELGLVTDKAKDANISVSAGADANKGADNVNFNDLKSETSSSSPLFENIASNFNKGSIEDADKYYSQLWQILFQQKLKWSKELYDQMITLNNHLIEALGRSYSESKKSAARIYELIKNARDSLKEGKKEASYKIYSEIEELDRSIPSVFFEEKRVIREQINMLSEELRIATNNELVKRVSALVQDINKLIDKANAMINFNDFANAVLSYNQCLESYNQMPEGFLMSKTSLGLRILEIYKVISIHSEIMSLQEQIGRHTLALRSHVKAATHVLAAQNKAEPAAKSLLLRAKKERAKKNMDKGFYNEAYKDIEQALQIEPHDVEAKVIHAKIKTMQ